MKEKTKTSWSSPDKNLPPGTLVRFISADPRFKGENPRSPGHDLLDKLAIVVCRDGDDYHSWGGIFRFCLEDGSVFRHHGDFVEIVE